MKIKALPKFFPCILLGHGEQAVFDHFKNDFAEIFAGLNAPGIEDHHGHGAVFVEGVLADAVEELGDRDVVLAELFNEARFLARFDLGFLAEIEGLAEKYVRFAVVARVCFNDTAQFTFKINRLHY